MHNNFILISVSINSSVLQKIVKFKDLKRPLSDSPVLLDFSLTVKAATLIFISGRCSAISSAKQAKSGSIYNLVKN